MTKELFNALMACMTDVETSVVNMGDKPIYRKHEGVYDPMLSMLDSAGMWECRLVTDSSYDYEEEIGRTPDDWRVKIEGRISPEDFNRLRVKESAEHYGDVFRISGAEFREMTHIEESVRQVIPEERIGTPVKVSEVHKNSLKEIYTNLEVSPAGIPTASRARDWGGCVFNWYFSPGILAGQPASKIVWANTWAKTSTIVVDYYEVTLYR